MQKIEAVLKCIDRVFFWLAVLTLGGMVVAIFVQVIFRYIIHAPLAWSEELARFLFIWMTFVGGYVAARRGQHIGVEIIQNMLPKIAKKAVGVLANLISAVFFCVVAYYCISIWDRLSMQHAAALKLPMSFVYLGIILGCIFMGLCYFFFAVALCVPQKAGREK
jgi:TRAP-type C4-dicarboxylate transport system permease small subunit